MFKPSNHSPLPPHFSVMEVLQHLHEHLLSQGMADLKDSITAWENKVVPEPVVQLVDQATLDMTVADLADAKARVDAVTAK